MKATEPIKSLLLETPCIGFPKKIEHLLSLMISVRPVVPITPFEVSGRKKSPVFCKEKGA
jgi:hypothetical protein